MTNPKTTVLRIPAQPEATLADVFSVLHFGRGNGDGVAEWFKDVSKPWTEDHLVWLCPMDAGARFDCLHSLYGAAVKEQSVFVNLLGVHGLYLLAAYLKEHEVPELREFTGIVHAFAGSKPSKKTVLNHQQGIASDALDFNTPVLYITGGRPRSIYTMWHTDSAEDQSLIAWCGPTSIFQLEHETARLAA